MDNTQKVTGLVPDTLLVLRKGGFKNYQLQLLQLPEIGKIIISLVLLKVEIITGIKFWSTLAI